nr:DUF4230 domain-containing protein [Allomuricauda sp.]
MKKVLIGALIAITSILIYKSCADDIREKGQLEENSMLIQQELQNVSKLVVTEGHFAEVYNYKDSQELFGSWLTAEKKALVVVNAEVLVVYDLSKLDYTIDLDSKTLTLKNIPEPEIKINPDFEYYDVSSDYFNPFGAEDYNAIKKRVNTSLLKKIEASTLKSNAKNRLVTELSKILVLTNSMGWKLVAEDEIVNRFDELDLQRNTVLD